MNDPRDAHYMLEPSDEALAADRERHEATALGVTDMTDPRDALIEELLRILPREAVINSLLLMLTPLLPKLTADERRELRSLVTRCIAHDKTNIRQLAPAVCASTATGRLFHD